jgi:hypothetical protein
LIPNCRDNIYAIAVAVAAHHMNVTNSLLVWMIILQHL